MLPIPFFKMYGDFSPTEPLPTNFEEAVRYYKSNQIKYIVRGVVHQECESIHKIRMNKVTEVSKSS